MNYFNGNRKDSRKHFKKDQPVFADCQTVDQEFKAFVKNVSSAGAFIQTETSVSVGEEIAMIFRFPKSKKIVKATGNITRITHEGVAVEFKIFFNK